VKIVRLPVEQRPAVGDGERYVQTLARIIRNVEARRVARERAGIIVSREGSKAA
jgi:hypothetical protein